MIRMYCRMAIRLFVGVLLIVGTCAAAGDPPNSADFLWAAAELSDNPAPAVEFPETTYRFDTVVSGLDISHTFIVKNRGTAPLEITRVKTG